MPQPSKPHPLSVRKKALRRLAKGERPAEVCRAMGLDPKTLRKWRKDAAEGRAPGVSGTPPLPMDAAPQALAIAKKEGETLAEMFARLVPVGTAEDVFRNVMLQKIATALQNSPIPQPTKISEFKVLANLAAQLLDIGPKPGRPAGKKGFSDGANLTIRLESLSKGPRVLDAEVVSVEVGDDEEDDEENSD